MILNMEFIRIALVGTPCSGKTAVLELLKRGISDNIDTRVELIGEAATELMADPRNIAVRETDAAEFQGRVALTQLAHEDGGFFRAVSDGVRRYMQITDRALLDAYVYLSDEARRNAGVSFPDINELYKRYDAIVFFDIYDLAEDIRDGNSLRAEKELGQLYELQERSLEVYRRHPVMFHVSSFDKIGDKAAFVAEILNGLAGETIFDADRIADIGNG